MAQHRSVDYRPHFASAVGSRVDDEQRRSSVGSTNVTECDRSSNALGDWNRTGTCVIIRLLINVFFMRSETQEQWNSSFTPPSCLVQVLSRMIPLVTTESSMAQVAYYSTQDPISVCSFASPQLKMGLSTAVLMLSFAAFAECARLSVHMSFMFRVVSSSQGYELELPLQDELVAMTHRVSIFFTAGLRLFFLFMVMVAWGMGITAMLCMSVVVFSMLVWSDYMPARLTTWRKTSIMTTNEEGETTLGDRLLQEMSRQGTRRSGGPTGPPSTRCVHLVFHFLRKRCVN